MEMLIPILAIICIFGLPVLVGGFVLVRLITSNNKERLELAKHGIIPPVRQKPSPNKYRSLRNGILCIGIAAGLIAGISIVLNINVDYYIEFLTVTASTVLFMGLAYVVFYLLVKDKNIEDGND